MKFCIYILWATMALLILSFGLYFYSYCISADGLDPIEAETLGIFIYTALGMLSAFILARKASGMRIGWFVVSFILYLLTWTFPSIIINSYLLMMVNAG